MTEHALLLTAIAADWRDYARKCSEEGRLLLARDAWRRAAKLHALAAEDAT